jgi:hypothetical protein
VPPAAVSYTEGPFTGSVTRTGAFGDPIAFTPGQTTNTVVTTLSSLNLECNNTSVAPLSLVDVEGEAPATTTTTAPAATPITTAAAAPAAPGPAVGGAAAGGGALPRTGEFDLELAGLGAALIGVGYGARAIARRRKHTADADSG